MTIPRTVLAVAALIIVNADRSYGEDASLKPHEGTSRGVIASKANESYQQAIETCAGGPRGQTGTPTFRGCLKNEAQQSDRNLNAVYQNTLKYLRDRPTEVARLRNAQQLWLQFRNTNCEFAKRNAPPGYADEFFDDCMLRSAIERASELSSLIGD